jgi:hypothetical protein
MNTVKTLTQKQLPEYLLNVAIVRPIFIWGAPGIGKSSIVEQFAETLGLVCVSLLGSQLAPEDIIGVPQILEGKSRFCPPTSIARDEPYCLFLDELNACSHEVQKSFYSLIHEKRVGEYIMPEGSIVIGAGNRTQDSAIVKPMSSALINRMIHVHLQVSTDDWLDWAYKNGIHDDIIEYIKIRPDHLWSQPPKHEEPFSTPRSWHMMSDALASFSETPTAEYLESLSYGCLTPTHAGQFIAFVKQAKNKFEINRILKGEIGWPTKPEDRDVLYFLAQSFRAQLMKELPEVKENINDSQQSLAHRAKALIKDLAQLSHEIAQMVVSDEDGETLPDWFMIEIFRDLPRLIERKN